MFKPPFARTTGCRAKLVAITLVLSACSTGSQPADWSELTSHPSEFFNLNPPVRLAGETIAGSTVALKRGQALVVRVPEDPATGYTWRMRPLQGGVVIAPVQHDYTAKQGADPAATAGGGEATFRLRAVAPGTQAITIDAIRPGFATPERSLAFDVVVR